LTTIELQSKPPCQRSYIFDRTHKTWCEHNAETTQGYWGGRAKNGNNKKLDVTSMMTNLKERLPALPIRTINMSNVKDAKSFEAAIGQVPYEAGGNSAYQRIAWVFGCVAWWLISQYGTVYDPGFDNDTNQEPWTSFLKAGNNERFVGDKDLPEVFPARHASRAW
jgi:hypothetical protein